MYQVTDIFLKGFTLHQGFTHQQIIDYYNSTEDIYRQTWDLENTLAKHLGYWDETVKDLSRALQRHNEILAKRAAIKKSDIVLDAGCGVGGSSIFLAKQYGCRVTGITLSQQEAQQASKNAEHHGVADKTDFFVMDFSNTTFPDESFDVIWALESVCHANDKQQFIQCAFRMLKKGGRLIVADGFAAQLHYTKSEEDIMQKWLFGWCVNFLETVANFDRYLENAGFKKIFFEDITSRVMPSSQILYEITLPLLSLTEKTKSPPGFKHFGVDSIVAAHYQYIALKEALWKYGIFFAKKS